MELSRLLPARRRRGKLAGNIADLPDMTSLRREMNRLFDNFLDWPNLPFPEKEGRLARFAPSINVSEKPKEIRVTAELPGLDEKDISVTLENDNLLIKGEKREEKKEEDEAYYHREMSYGSFRRVIPLAAKVDAEKIEAKFKKGVLKITLPKIPGAKSEKGRKIEIKS